MTMKCSIIMPCYDEEPIIEKSYNKLQNVLKEFPNNKFEIIFVNDGSNDRTGEILLKKSLKENNIGIISYKKNKGYGYALRKGLGLASGEIIITCDCDLAMPPNEVIASCLNWIKNGQDMVICSRYKGIKSEYPLARRIASWGYRTLNKTLFKFPFEDTQSGFIGFKKEVLEGIELKSNDFSILMELIVKVYKNKWQIMEIPVKFIHNTLSGETSIWKSGPKMFKNTLKIWREINEIYMEK